MPEEFKVHLRSSRERRVTACNLIDPGTPPEAVLLTTDYTRVTCATCRRTTEWFAAKAAARTE